jgi:hypothetical protein
VNRGYLGIILVVLAIVGISVWMANNTHWEEVTERTPLQGPAQHNPFYSVQRLSELLGARTRVRKEIVTPPPTNAVLVVAFWNWILIPERRDRIERWVRDGGRLVVGSDILSYDEFDNWAGVKRQAADSEENNSTRLKCTPLHHRLTVDTPASTDMVASPREHFELCQFVGNGLRTTRKVDWRLQDNLGHTQAVRIPIGRGSVTVIDALAFGNLDLLCGDSGALFAAATQLHRGDQIEFLTESEGGMLLKLLWTYGAPVIVLGLLLIALWLWRSGVRFGPLVAAADPARRSLAEQIRGTGLFTLRFGGGRALHAATVRALSEAAARCLPHYDRLPGPERVEALASLTGLGAKELAAALEEPGARRRDIRRTIALLEAARRRITLKTT